MTWCFSLSLITEVAQGEKTWYNFNIIGVTKKKLQYYRLFFYFYFFCKRYYRLLFLSLCTIVCLLQSCDQFKETFKFFQLQRYIMDKLASLYCQQRKNKWVLFSIFVFVFFAFLIIVTFHVSNNSSRE